MKMNVSEIGSVTGVIMQNMKKREKKEKKKVHASDTLAMFRSYEFLLQIEQSSKDQEAFHVNFEKVKTFAGSTFDGNVSYRLIAIKALFVVTGLPFLRSP